MSFPIQRICNIMSISKSGFYKWRSRLRNPNDKIIKRSNDILLFTEYHQKYPNHGYRWLKAKILLDLGVIYSDNYAHRCCKYAGVKSSSKRGDRNTYINGLLNLIEKKKEYTDLKMIIHTDQGSVYSSKSFNELLPLYNITHSMSRVGTPTDNASMESINGWLKEELFNDFDILDTDNVEKCIEDYIHFFNYERPAYALNYLTPIQFKEKNLIRSS